MNGLRILAMNLPDPGTQELAKFASISATVAFLAGRAKLGAGKIIHFAIRSMT